MTAVSRATTLEIVEQLDELLRAVDHYLTDLLDMDDDEGEDGEISIRTARLLAASGVLRDGWGLVPELLSRAR